MKYLFTYDDYWIDYQYNIFVEYKKLKKSIYEYNGLDYSFEEFLHNQDWVRFQELSFHKISTDGYYDFWVPYFDFSGFGYYQCVMNGIHRMFYRDNKIVRYAKLHKNI